MITAIVLALFAAMVRKGFLVRPIPNESSKQNLLELELLPGRIDGWLDSPTGEWTVAIGLFATAVSLFAFTAQDLWLLLTGHVFRLGLLRSVWYLLWAGLASISSAACVLLYRSVWARLAIALFSVAMVSHIVERFVFVPVPQLRLVALCRLLISISVVLVYLRHRPAAEKPRPGEE